MATRTTAVLSNPGFIVDFPSVDRSTGRQVNWALVPAGYQNENGKKEIPAGTVMSEDDNGQVYPRADADTGTNPTHTARFIAETNMVEDEKEAALSGYGMILGGAFYENLLPDSTGTPKQLPADFVTELRASGTGYAFEQYTDSRLS